MHPRRPVLRTLAACLSFAWSLMGAAAQSAGCDPPGEATGLMFAADGMTLRWEEPSPGAGGILLFDLLSSHRPWDFSDTEGACVESNGDDLEAFDPVIPELGQVVSYIPRPESECGQGPLGTDSSGTPRPQGRQCGECLSDATCDDGLICNGAEACLRGGCFAGAPPDCGPFACNEAAGGCVTSCVDDDDCASGFGCFGGQCLRALDVTSTADEPDVVPDDGTCATAMGGCTLRAAIQTVNEGAPFPMIRLPEGIFVLTRAGAGEDAGATGDLDIHHNMVIRGASAARSVIDAQEIDRVFQVHSTASAVTLARLKVQRGRAPDDPGSGVREDGGGILNEGNLNLVEVGVNACRTEGDGGGILNRGGLSLMRSAVGFNQATGRGGGIGNLGVMSLEASTVSTNMAGTQGGGIYQDPILGGDVSLRNVTVYRNGAEDGGGLYWPGGALSMVNTALVGSVSGGDCSAAVPSNGHNAASDLSCDLTGPGDLPNIAPMLSELTVFVDSGIRTHYPLEGSPLDGAGDRAELPAVDQNGTSTDARPAFIGSVATLPQDTLLGSGRVFVASTAVAVLNTLLLGNAGTVNLPGIDDFAVHPDGTRVYARRSFGTLFVIDTATLGFAPVLTVNSLSAIAMHPAGTYVFASGLSSNDTPTLWAIDTATHQVAGSVTLPDVANDLAVQDLGNVLIANLGIEEKVRAFLANGSLTGLPTQPYPSGWQPLDFAPGLFGTFYTFDRNAAAGQHRISLLPWYGTVPLPFAGLPDSSFGPLDIARHPDASRVYATQFDTSGPPRLHVVDVGLGQVTGTLPDGGGELAMHPAGLTLYAAQADDGVVVISTATNSILTTVPFPGGASGIAVKP